jgi:hypothetical protein
MRRKLLVEPRPLLRSLPANGGDSALGIGRMRIREGIFERNDMQPLLPVNESGKKGLLGGDDRWIASLIRPVVGLSPTRIFRAT